MGVYVGSEEQCFQCRQVLEHLAVILQEEKTEKKMSLEDEVMIQLRRTETGRGTVCK